MTFFLEKFDSPPLNGGEFTFQFTSWLSIMIETLNEVIGDIQEAFNLLQIQPHTAAEITTLQSNGDLVDGMILYDSTNNEYVGRISGVLVKFTTAAYP